jgi:hypothetical protein
MIGIYGVAVTVCAGIYGVVVTVSTCGNKVFSDTESERGIFGGVVIVPVTVFVCVGTTSLVVTDLSDTLVTVLWDGNKTSFLVQIQ